MPLPRTGFLVVGLIEGGKPDLQDVAVYVTPRALENRRGKAVRVSSPSPSAAVG